MTALGLGLASAPAADPPAADGQQPNIIVIQTDDQDIHSLNARVMPNLVNLLAAEGTIFTDYIDSGPLCCPSRAVMLTGQYGHNNGVLWNNPNPYGDLRGKDNTLPVWLQQAGYVTAHLGKYLNLYSRAVGDPNEVPPGWDEWHTALDRTDTGAPLNYYNYTLRENGHAVEYGSENRDYVTRVLDDKAVHLIHEYVPGPEPLFLALDEVAPHNAPNRGDPRCTGSPLPSPRDLHLFESDPLPRPPSFNEADVRDKPRFVRARPQFNPGGIADLQRRYGCRLASLRAVDRGVAHIYTALQEEGELDNTAIFFTSDNGYILGQHRGYGKVDPYEGVLHVPFVVRLPPAMLGPRGAPSTLSSTVANIDIAPTIVQLSGAMPCPIEGPCRVLDGRSLLPAIRSQGRNWPANRAILLELKGARGGQLMPCDYRGVHTTRQAFVEYHGATRVTQGAGPCEPDNEFEHYNLHADPFELDNIYPAAPGTPEAAQEQTLRRLVARLSDCAGIEGRDPVPPSGHYCE